MAIVVRNEGAKVNSNINVTPMVDVMLELTLAPSFRTTIDMMRSRAYRRTAVLLRFRK